MSGRLKEVSQKLKLLENLDTSTTQEISLSPPPSWMETHSTKALLASLSMVHALKCNGYPVLHQKSSLRADRCNLQQRAVDMDSSIRLGDLRFPHDSKRLSPSRMVSDWCLRTACPGSLIGTAHMSSSHNSKMPRASLAV